MHFECQLQEHMLSSKNWQPSALFMPFVSVTYRPHQKQFEGEQTSCTVKYVDQLQEREAQCGVMPML